MKLNEEMKKFIFGQQFWIRRVLTEGKDTYTGQVACTTEEGEKRFKFVFSEYRSGCAAA